MDKPHIVLEITTIVAILVGPIAALYVQRLLDEGRAHRDRKLWIFKTLMAFRRTPMAKEYVQALNLIDVEFTANNKKEKTVREAWQELFDLFSNYKTTPNASEEAEKLRARLLSAIGESLGYSFSTVNLRRGAYYPEFLGNVEEEQHALRRAFLDLFQGKRRIPVGVFEESFPAITVPRMDGLLPDKKNESRS